MRSRLKISVKSPNVGHILSLHLCSWSMAGSSLIPGPDGIEGFI